MRRILMCQQFAKREAGRGARCAAKGPAASAGFTLLEAIVAMALIATAAMALFAWIYTSFVNLARIQSANARALAETNALQFVQTVNPMKTPSGQTTLGGLKVEWRARPVSERRGNLGESGDPGVFTVALYEIEVAVEQLPDVPRDTFLIRQLGFERQAYQLDPFSAPASQPGSKSPAKPVKGK